MLAPDGVLLVSTPNRGVYEEDNPHHLHELSSEEFEAALRERFAHVRILRQQTHATSLLAGDDTVALADSAVPVALDVRKVTGAAPGEELYTVACRRATSRRPTCRSWRCSGPRSSLSARRREVDAWKQRALLAESAAASERVRARDAVAARERAQREETQAAPAAKPLGRLQALLRRR